MCREEEKKGTLHHRIAMQEIERFSFDARNSIMI
jgi:hypothetical protein